MKPMSGKRLLQIAMLSGQISLLLIASGCVTSTGTTGIEKADADKATTGKSRLSLCENVSRQELMYSRNDTQGTKDALGGVIEKYDRICGTRPASQGK